MKPLAGLSLLLAICCASITYTQPATRAWPKDEPTRMPDFGLVRAGIICTDVDSLTFGDLPDVVMVSGSNVGATNSTSAYGCEEWSEEGGEVVYKVILDQETLLSVELTTQPVDLDLFLLADCESDNCIIAGSSSFSLSLEAGVYWLVVDGYHGAEGDFDLTAEARTTGVSETICDNAEVIPASLGIWATESSCFEQENLLQAYDCSTTPEAGGEVWYRYGLLAGCTFSADLTPPNFDGALWLFRACGTEASPAECIGFSDDRVAGGREDVSWYNDTGETVSLVLAADCYAPPPSYFGGTFNLEIEITSDYAICDDTNPDLTELVVAPGVEAVDGTLGDKPNNLPMVDCVDGLLVGGEAWYRVTVPPEASGTIALSSDFDGVLMRFDDCVAAASCVGEDHVSNTGGVGEDESLSFANEGVEDLVFFLAVDSLSANATTFQLTWPTLTPTSETTMGALRNRFR